MKHFLLVLGLLGCTFAFAQFKDEIENPLVPHENSIELGLRGGLGLTYGPSATSTNDTRMTPDFRLMFLGQTVDDRGVAKLTWLFPRTLGFNLAYRKAGENPMNSWAVRLGVQRTQQNYYYNYPYPLNDPLQSNAGGWVQDFKFNTYSFTIQRAWQGNFAQLSVSPTFGKILQDDIPHTQTGPLSYVDGEGNGAIVSSTPLKKQSLFITPEFGWKGVYETVMPYEVSVGLNIPLGNVMQQDFDLRFQGQNLTTNTLKYNLGSFFVNLNLPVTAHSWKPAPKRTPTPKPPKEKKEKVPKPVKPKETDKPDKGPQPPIAKPSKSPKPPKVKPPKVKKPKPAPQPKPLPQPKPDKPPKPEKEVVQEQAPRKEVRKFNQQEEFTVKKQTVTIKYYDNFSVDGDVISLYLNGELLVKKQKVDLKPKTLTVTLKPGENYLVMRAENEGRIPPNTAAITVDDGKQSQTAILRAKKRKNVAIKIVYQP